MVKNRVNRRQELLEAAARLFASSNYQATSMRDIAAEVGMLPGSVYYHFKSKEEILLAVHRLGVENVRSAVEEAVASAGDDAWDRLAAAAAAHLDALLGENPFSQIVTPQFVRGLSARLRKSLISQRDEYENLFESLVRKLPLPRGTDRRLLRLSLLGSLNWTVTWYQPGQKLPSEIATTMVDFYRRPLDRQFGS